ncbi:hypothetical protein SFRURICE_017069 [Spodoptera frugiperda]|nr:hypothetical protein SFRURICE_017069 [Spodoptera frugiperda]
MNNILTTQSILLNVKKVLLKQEKGKRERKFYINRFSINTKMADILKRSKREYFIVNGTDGLGKDSNAFVLCKVGCTRDRKTMGSEK